MSSKTGATEIRPFHMSQMMRYKSKIDESMIQVWAGMSGSAKRLMTGSAIYVAGEGRGDKQNSRLLYPLKTRMLTMAVNLPGTCSLYTKRY